MLMFGKRKPWNGSKLCLHLIRHQISFTSNMDAALGWARKFSIFQYPFVTACCGMEYMSTAAGHYDVDRFGAGFPRFSPRQSDVLFVVGTISHKMAPVLKNGP
jgi:NADH-quinone oxidoreductase subunit B